MKKMVSALLNTTSQLGAIVAVFLLVYFIFGGKFSAVLLLLSKLFS